MTSSTTNAEAAQASAKSAIPLALTIARIVAAPVTAGLILWAQSWVYADHYLAGALYGGAGLLFVAAALTDWLDGYLARKLDAVTPLGAALDHSADKVLITCVLVALAYAALPMDLAVAAIIILGRDVAIAGLREGLAASGKSLPVSSLGKWKAAAEMAGVGAFIVFQATALLGVNINFVLGLWWAARILIWAGAGLALASAALYIAAAFSRPRGPVSPDARTQSYSEAE